ncbi:MAG: hypothetical protein WCJ30_09780 [Deltaproteobacteria bacterium]
MWFIAGVERRESGLSLRPSLLATFGVGRHAAYRALAQLEGVGLVVVKRARGRAAVVTLLVERECGHHGFAVLNDSVDGVRHGADHAATPPAGLVALLDPVDPDRKAQGS